MDILRKKYKRGEIDKKTYQEKATEISILHLESISYQYIGKIADGTHGIVVELKNPNSALRVAVKIVIDEFATEGEMDIWPKLVNEHILPQIKWQSIVEANTKAFFSLKHPATLKDKLNRVSFTSDSNGFENSVSCVKDITNGIHYLHEQGFCHMNLQTDHILLKGNNKARIGSFGYLTLKDSNEFKYGASEIFRPPEAFHGTNSKIDGQKFDVWSLGILVTEIFTGQYLTKEVSKWKSKPSSWYFNLYGTIFDLLEKENFKKMVKKTFKNCTDMDSKIDQILNFISSCLIFNPGDRSSVEELLKHQLIGGQTEKYYPTVRNDIWAEKMSPVDLLMLGLQLNQTVTRENTENTENGENLNMSREEIWATENLKNTSHEWEKEESMESSERENNPTALNGDHDNLIDAEKEEVDSEDSNPIISNKNTGIQHSSNEDASSDIHLANHGTVEKYSNIVFETGSAILYESCYGDEEIIDLVKKDELKENLDTINMESDVMIRNDSDTSLNKLPKDFSDSHFEEKLYLHENPMNEMFCRSDLFNNNEIKSAEEKDEGNTANNICIAGNYEHFDKHKFEPDIKYKDKSIKAKTDEFVEKRNDKNPKIAVCKMKNGGNIYHNNFEQEDLSLEKNSL